MGHRTITKKHDVEVAGLTVYSEETTYEQKTFLGIDYGEEEEVGKKREILPMSDETRDTLVNIGGSLLGGMVARKQLK